MAKVIQTTLYKPPQSILLPWKYDMIELGNLTLRFKFYREVLELSTSEKHQVVDLSISQHHEDFDGWEILVLRGKLYLIANYKVFVFDPDYPETILIMEDR